MFELITVILFIWLLVKAIGLAVKMTWGLAKVAASVLIVLAVSVLILCLVFAGAIPLLIPVAVIGLAVGILKVCV